MGYYPDYPIVLDFQSPLPRPEVILDCQGKSSKLSLVTIVLDSHSGFKILP